MSAVECFLVDDDDDIYRAEVSCAICYKGALFYFKQ
jgi:hypothetical protein